MSIGQSNKEMSAPLLRIYTLGQFTVSRDDEVIADSAWKRRKAKSLFKLLLATSNHQLLKDQVLEWLWPNQDPIRAGNNLNYTLYVLRRILQPDLNKGSSSPYILFKDDILTLNDAIVWIDKDEFEHLIQLGRQQNDKLSYYEAARTLYQGDFLPDDIYEEWANSPRVNLMKAYADLLQRIAHIYTQRGDYNKAISCLRDHLTIDPTHEEAYRDLMCLYAQLGQRHQALYLYKQAYSVLQDELGIEPALETQSLYEAILEGRWSPPVQPATQSIISPKVPNYLLETVQQPFVGREKEMRQLKLLFRQLESGSGSVIMLSGEQGIGKTRLAREFITRAHAAEIRILYGPAHEQEGHLPYGPFIEAIRSAFLDEESLKIVRQQLGWLLEDLARILPELADAGLSAAPQQFELELGQERQRLFDAVVLTLTLFAQQSSLFIFLEDLHAAGESSLQLLHYLARRISEVPILIVCTVREEAIRRGTPIARLCKELNSSQLAQNIHLSRLDERETYKLCLEILGGDQLDSHLSDTLYGLTEGNPFFIQELVLTLKDTGKLEQLNGNWHFMSGSHLTVPTSIREVISLRLERLSREAYRLAGLAAVIGREISYDLLQATAQCSNSTLLDLLDELLQASLIEEIENGYRFCHGLTRQVIYDDLTTHRRAWLHGQVAQALEQLTPYQLDEQAAILVHHFERAGRFEIAFRYLIRAGDWAKATYATREALDYYNQALSLRRQYSELSAADITTDLLERRAQTYLILSDFDSAIADLEKSLDLNRESGDTAREGEALYQLGIAHYWAHRLAKATIYLNQALQLAEDTNAHELHAKSLRLRDILDSTQGNVQPEDSAQEKGLVEHSYDLPAEEHWGRALLAHLRSDFETAIHHASTCIELGQTFANTFLMLGGYFVLGMSQASSGDYQPALKSLMYALKLSGDTEDRFWRARLLNTIGWVHRELFDLERAIQFDEASLALARIGEPRLTEAEGNALANLATDYLLLEAYDQVQKYLAEGLNPSNNETFMRWRYLTRMIVIKGRLALVEGDIQSALAAADEALVIARDTQARKNIVRSCRLRGEALLAMNEIDRSRAALCHALSIGETLKSPSLIRPCYTALAQLEESAGNLESAQAHYFEASKVLIQVANRLTDPALYQPFLTAPHIQNIISKAVCPII